MSRKEQSLKNLDLEKTKKERPVKYNQLRKYKNQKELEEEGEENKKADGIFTILLIFLKWYVFLNIICKTKNYKNWNY